MANAQRKGSCFTFSVQKPLEIDGSKFLDGLLNLFALFVHDSFSMTHPGSLSSLVFVIHENHTNTCKSFFPADEASKPRDSMSLNLELTSHTFTGSMAKRSPTKCANDANIPMMTPTALPSLNSDLGLACRKRRRQKCPCAKRTSESTVYSVFAYSSQIR